MKLSCLPVSLFREIVSGQITIKDWAKEAKKAGLDSIDISALFVKAHTPVYLKEFRNAIAAENMTVTMLATYPDLCHPDSIERKRQLEYLGNDIAVASYLGAKYVRVLAGQAHPETPVDKGIKWAVEGLKQASKKAELFGVELVYENHSKPGSWDYTDFSHPTEIFLKIVEQTKDIGLGINFDTANVIAYGDDTIQVLKQVIDRVVTIHANDTSTRGSLTPVLLGEGLVPFEEIFKTLKSAGFDGWICIEEASGRGIDGVVKATEFVRRVWGLQ